VRGTLAENEAAGIPGILHVLFKFLPDLDGDEVVLCAEENKGRRHARADVVCRGKGGEVVLDPFVAIAVAGP
jgi:hypothetical protein